MTSLTGDRRAIDGDDWSREQIISLNLFRKRAMRRLWIETILHRPNHRQWIFRDRGDH